MSERYQVTAGLTSEFSFLEVSGKSTAKDCDDFFRYTSDRSIKLADEPSNDGKQHHPHDDGGVPILSRPLTAEEREKQSEKQADAAYKVRQLTLTESANRLTATNVVLTWILATFTAIGAVAAVYQGIQANENAKSAKISADAAKCAADIAGATLNEMKADAQNTLKQTREAAHLDQRAWVVLSQLELVQTDSGHVLKGFVLNSGKTPANDVHAAAGIYAHNDVDVYYKLNDADYDWIRYILRKTWNKEIKQTDYLAAPIDIQPRYLGRLPPGVNPRRDSVSAPRLEDMGVLPPGNNPYNFPFADFLRGSATAVGLIFYGEIRYKDFTGQQQETQFCYLIPRERGKADPVIPCGKGNEMKVGD